MRKPLAILLTLALLLALCACGAAEEEIDLKLPGGLRFGMSPEEVAALLGEKLGDTKYGEAYTPEYRMRPEGFDSDHRLSPLGINLLVEYTDGKLSRVYYMVYLRERDNAATRYVLSSAETYYTELLGEPETNYQDPVSGYRSIVWRNGRLSLSLLLANVGGVPSFNLDFACGDAK
ncbi:MAG: hypothetical protein IJK63_12540 [Oscillospiraceae bacterium]|nr:hypothetical protein [Oscillospiraceae bacterium]